MTTRQLQAFLTCAELGSFTRAALVHHVTQAGMSAMIQELETQVGQRLFERGHRSVELTSAGREFLPYARNAVEMLENGLAGLSSLQRRESGGIRIAVSPAVAETLLPPVVRQFAAQEQGASCEIIDTELDQFHRLLERDEVDAAYGNDATVTRGLIAEPIFRTRISLVVPSGAYRRCKSISRPEDWAPFEQARWLRLPIGNAFQRTIDRFMLQCRAPVMHRQELQHLSTIIAFVHAGLGVAFVPEFMLEPLRRLDIRVIPIRTQDVSVDFHCLTRADKPLSPQLLRFNALLRDAGEARYMIER